MRVNYCSWGGVGLVVNAVMKRQLNVFIEEVLRESEWEYVTPAMSHWFPQDV